MTLYLKTSFFNDNDKVNLKLLSNKIVHCLMIVTLFTWLQMRISQVVAWTTIVTFYNCLGFQIKCLMTYLGIHRSAGYGGDRQIDDVLLNSRIAVVIETVTWEMIDSACCMA